MKQSIESKMDRLSIEVVQSELEGFKDHKRRLEKESPDDYQNHPGWIDANSKVVEREFFLNKGYWPVFKKIGTFNDGFMSGDLVDLNKIENLPAEKD